jgi:hypothetical protein
MTYLTQPHKVKYLPIHKSILKEYLILILHHLEVGRQC